jgi:hypothetical protein
MQRADVHEAAGWANLRRLRTLRALPVAPEPQGQRNDVRLVPEAFRAVLARGVNMTARLIYADMCRHFVGVQHEVCEAGIKLVDVRDASHPGPYRWPCVTPNRSKPATTVCPKRSLLTQEEHEARVASLFAAADKADAAVSAGKCAECGADIEPSTIIGRCRYASCGHRLGQVDDVTEEP